MLGSYVRICFLNILNTEMVHPTIDDILINWNVVTGVPSLDVVHEKRHNFVQ